MAEQDARGRLSAATNAGIIIILAAAVGMTLYVKRPGAKPAPASEEASDVAAVAAAPEPAPPKAAPLPRLVDLGADKCIPCKMMAPLLAELRTEYAGRLEVEFIDVWKNRGAGDQYGIRMIPTQIFFDASGKELYRHQGFYSKEDILAKWKELGVDLGDGNDSESK